jgi:hypothetical protein
VVRGQLYVVGGVCGPLALNHVECFDSAQQKWLVVKPLRETRSACGVAAVGDNIFAVGGINSMGDTIRSGEVFNVITQVGNGKNGACDLSFLYSICKADSAPCCPCQLYHKRRAAARSFFLNVTK